MVGLVPYAELGGPAPIAVTIDYAREAARGTPLEGLLRMMPLIVKIGILAGLTSTMVVQMMAQPRIFMAMSKDGLLPPWMGRVHPRFGTPHLTTIATGVGRRAGGGAHADRCARPHGEHRHAVRVRGGVGRRAGAAANAPGSAAAVQGAVVAGGAGAVGAGVAAADAEPSGRDLDQAGGLDGASASRSTSPTATAAATWDAPSQVCPRATEMR